MFTSLYFCNPARGVSQTLTLPPCQQREEAVTLAAWAHLCKGAAILLAVLLAVARQVVVRAAGILARASGSGVWGSSGLACSLLLLLRLVLLSCRPVGDAGCCAGPLLLTLHCKHSTLDTCIPISTSQHKGTTVSRRDWRGSQHAHARRAVVSVSKWMHSSVKHTWCWPVEDRSALLLKGCATPWLLCRLELSWSPCCDCWPEQHS